MKFAEFKMRVKKANKKDIVFAIACCGTSIGLLVWFIISLL